VYQFLKVEYKKNWRGRRSPKRENESGDVGECYIYIYLQEIGQLMLERDYYSLELAGSPALANYTAIK
jgi:hypothetical protein